MADNRPAVIENLRNRIHHMQDRLHEMTSLIPEVGSIRVPPEAFELIDAIEDAEKAVAWAEEQYQENPHLFDVEDESWLIEYALVQR